MEDPFQRDQFAEKFTAGMAASDPRSAVSMAASISDAARREAALSAVLTLWRAQYPAEVTAWEASRKSGASE